MTRNGRVDRGKRRPLGITQETVSSVDDQSLVGSVGLFYELGASLRAGRDLLPCQPECIAGLYVVAQPVGYSHRVLRCDRSSRKYHADQAMLLLKRHLDLPVDILAAPSVFADEYNRARAARDVIFSNAPHDVVDVLAIDAPFERIVSDDVVSIAKLGLRKRHSKLGRRHDGN